MSYLGNAPESVFTEMKYQDLTGGSGTSFTLNQAVSNPQEIEVFVNNVRQEPSAAYSVSGTTLTMTESVGASEDFYVVFQGMAQGSATHPATQSLEAAAGTFTGDVAIDSDGGFLFDVSDKALNFGDNYVAKFGDGNDLQIFHNGSLSHIRDAGTGELRLSSNGDQIRLYDTSANRTMLQCLTGQGLVTLWYNNSKKFETTNTGVDVTGTTTTDGLTSSAALDVTTSTHANASVFKSTGNTQIMLQDTDATANDQFWGLQVSGGDFNILTCNDDRASGFSTPLYITQAGTVVSSSGVAIGGTGAANTLDDYEEGTFTPAYSTASATATATGRYTKVGRIVTVQIEIRWTQSGTSFGSISGLPFATSTLNYQTVVSKEYYSDGHAYHTFVQVGATATGNWRKISNNSLTANNAQQYGFGFSFTYHTA